MKLLVLSTIASVLALYTVSATIDCHGGGFKLTLYPGLGQYTHIQAVSLEATSTSCTTTEQSASISELSIQFSGQGYGSYSSEEVISALSGVVRYSAVHHSANGEQSTLQGSGQAKGSLNNTGGLSLDGHVEFGPVEGIPITIRLYSLQHPSCVEVAHMAIFDH
ncbi:hypothetical protein GQ42DRAFT_179964 [Ramicandelaber brevisporus]|nr:hypothetical protein GQ42DRAFT_179964 [Ramicandelaber brevisporus]